MKPEEMKKAWNDTGNSLGNRSQTPDPNIIAAKKTSLDSLRDRYRRFFTIGFIMAAVSFIMFGHSNMLPEEFRLPVSMAFFLYFIIAALMDLWLWKELGRINPVTMTVTEVAGKAMLYRKRHLQFMIVLIPMAITLIGLLCYAFSSEIYFIYGVATGAVLGIIFGIREFRRFMADYRRLSD